MPTPPTLPAPDEIHLLLVPRGADPGSEPALRRALGRYLGAGAATATLVRNPHGRPELAPPHDALRFSLSHSGPWLLLALAVGVQPGVDLERTRPRPNAGRLAVRYFDPVEAAALQALPEAARELRFYRGWTAREAVLKAIGRGLAFGLQRLRIDVTGDGGPRLAALDGDDPAAWQLHAPEAPEGFVAALAWRGGPRRIRRIAVDPQAA